MRGEALKIVKANNIQKGKSHQGKSGLPSVIEGVKRERRKERGEVLGDQRLERQPDWKRQEIG